MLSFLENSLLGFYNYLFDFTHDYGLALIVFVFFLRIALLPLNYLIFLEEKKLLRLKPQLEEIMKNKKMDLMEQLDKINALYKKEKFNPVFNIFIQLLPLPLLISIFFVLRKIMSTQKTIYFLNLINLSEINYFLIILTISLQFLYYFLFNKRNLKEQFLFSLVIIFILFQLPSFFTLYWFINLLFLIFERKLFEIYYVKFGVVSVEENNSQRS